MTISSLTFMACHAAGNVALPFFGRWSQKTVLDFLPRVSGNPHSVF